MCWLLASTVELIAESKKSGKNVFEARNTAQVYKSRDLTRAYAEYYALKSFQQRLTEPDITESLKPVLHLSYFIYGFWSIDKHLPSFYQVS